MNLTRTQRLVAFGAVCVAATLASVIVVLAGRHTSPQATRVSAGAAAAADGGAPPDESAPAYLEADSPAAAQLLAGPHFVSVRYPHRNGEPYRVELVPAANPNGARLDTGLSCVKVHERSGTGICLVPPTDSLGVTVQFFDRAFHVTRELVLAGTPSRARLSPGGRRGAVTNFLSGHSYEDTTFTTATTILDLRDGTSSNLESWTAFDGARQVTEKSRNFWGVTFTDDDTFYVSMGIRAERYLLRADTRTRTMQVIGTRMECPSVAPDGRHLTFRRSVVESNGTTAMPLFVLDLQTMQERRLTYWSTVDGQPEWLDDHRILIGTPTGPPDLAVLDINEDHTPGDRPEILLRDSLAVSFEPSATTTTG